MSLLQILATFFTALLYRLLTRLISSRTRTHQTEWGRTAFLFGASVLVVYWLQPSLPIRGLDYWLPTLTLALTVFCWAAVTPARNVLFAPMPLPSSDFSALLCWLPFLNRLDCLPVSYHWLLPRWRNP